ncbi:MAG: PLP-dependent transferase [Desulfobacteraceae bacterium]|nr:PLP-dependent transferase [Desulfobacteraceae bacterium]
MIEKMLHFETRAIHEGIKGHDREASTQYVSFPRELKDCLADPCLLRFSVGIEHVADICGDLSAALEKV